MAKRNNKSADNLKGKKYKFNIEDHIVAEEWTYIRPGKTFFDVDYLEILDFFCMHSPCRQGSFSPLTLEKIGWKNQWNSKKFRDKVSELLGLTDENFKVTKYQHDFKEIWSASGIIDDFSRMRYPFAYLAEAGETNDFMNLFHRIRNSFAHGRYKIIRDNGEYYIYFEDVKQDNGYIYVLGRMCLTKTGLDNLRKFLMREDPSSTSFKSLLSDDS